ncbi:hypothetical protein SH449x_001518 [Pirellulaceae bacterium SH449]
MEAFQRLSSRKTTGMWRFVIRPLTVCLSGWIWFSIPIVAFPDDFDSSFSIQVIEPYPTQVPLTHANEDLGAQSLTLDESQILKLLNQYYAPVGIVQSLAKPSSSKSHLSPADQARESITCLLAQTAAERIRTERAAAALKAHYGIAASQFAANLIERTRIELNAQDEIQARLIEAGISIPDDSLLTRLRNETNDAALETNSKEQIIRIDLSGLIPASYACRYIPSVQQELTPSDIDVCEHIQQALECHYEIVALTRIRNLLSADTVNLGDEVLAALVKLPTLAARSVKLLDRIKAPWTAADRQFAANKQKQLLSSLIQERKAEISREIEIAYEKKKAAALRWSLSREQLELWTRRVEQLEKLGSENRGTIAELGAAKLARLKEESRVIERWLEWHLANVEFHQSMGSCRALF